MMIDPPSVDTDHPDRAIACEEALAVAFYRAVDVFPRHAWRGDESALWPVRRLAKTAGWGVDEIDAALDRLVETVCFAIEPGTPD
jgi:hypothetical protein